MLTALKRELSEEVGLKCESAKLADVYHNSSVSERDHVIIYSVENWQEEPALGRQTIEIAEKAWFNLDDLPKELSPCTKYALKHYQ